MLSRAYLVVTLDAVVFEVFFTTRLNLLTQENWTSSLSTYNNDKVLPLSSPQSQEDIQRRNNITFSTELYPKGEEKLDGVH
jgi:hypothetical protein